MHINSYYAAGKFYKNLYEEQKKQGLDIDVYVPVDYDHKNDFDFGKYSNISKCYNKYDRYVFKIKHNKILKDICDKYNILKYDLLHAHSLFSNGFIAYKLHKKYNKKYIVAVRNTDVNFFFKNFFWMRNLGISILENASKIIFISNTYRDFLIDTYVPNEKKDEFMKKSEVIPNGIDDFWFKNLNIDKKIEGIKQLRLLYVGEINKNKNITTTIKAIKVLISKGYDIRFDVVGKVSDDKIFNQIKDLEFINYLGVKNKEQLLSILRENHIFIMPSIYETFGLVYAEAMSQGLPVIYTKGQGFDGYFKQGEIGYAVDCFNHNEIVNSIELIINNYEEISRNCIQSIKVFYWNNLVRIYGQIYYEES